MTPYYVDDAVELYHVGHRDLVTHVGRVDAVITDPPYGVTPLAWDIWPEGWPALMAAVTDTLWTFGSMRTFLERASEFSDWTFAQDIIWEKHNGSGFIADRFRRVHEIAAHYYRGPWDRQYRNVPTTPDAVKKTVRRQRGPAHMGDIAPGSYATEEGGARLMRSVIPVRSEHGHAVVPTQKPAGIMLPLIEYSVPVGGVVLDPFAGSGTTGIAARLIGRRAILGEADERTCEIAAVRLSAQPLPFGHEP